MIIEQVATEYGTLTCHVLEGTSIYNLSQELYNSVDLRYLWILKKLNYRNDWLHMQRCDITYLSSDVTDLVETPYD
jgi:hypothetical protein